ncbi:GNAT family N-acetyltransferase [Puia dinghuensis]|uniref:GNAT family N-acetyltransferase n=1 Tax=Puia dinghuensis TaxID=1792502 RepID=UPI001E63071D|nr:GNAT family N-acetyltransferase [Puia dinghuensis]
MSKSRVGRSLRKDELHNINAPKAIASIVVNFRSPEKAVLPISTERSSAKKSRYNKKRGTGIREIALSDITDLAILLSQLGYPGTEVFLSKRLEEMLADRNEVLLVYERNFKVDGFIGLHFFRQLGLEGDFARITYFIVREGARSKGIGAELERCITELATERHCNRIELHCDLRREDAHRFYLRQGYVELPKYFIKLVASPSSVNSTIRTSIQCATISKAEMMDASPIQVLLDELGYSYTGNFFSRTMQQILSDPNEILLVNAINGHVDGFIGLHFFPQVGVMGDFARITYFCVREDARGQGIGSQMLNFIYELAAQRNCNRIEVHCHTKRLDAHRFYLQNGYEESPKYFIKLLVTN